LQWVDWAALRTVKPKTLSTRQSRINHNHPMAGKRSAAKNPPPHPCDDSLERAARTAGQSPVCGIDEAGRGPLAGPVVAAAAILPAGFSHPLLDDSKKLTARRREAVFDDLMHTDGLRWTCETVGIDEIEHLNILGATHAAMRRCIAAFGPPLPALALIDGLPVPEFPIPQNAVVGGDALSLSIAAASIIAKVTRDRIMRQHAAEYPGYGFDRHMGYGTRDHLEALNRLGPCPIHRKRFAPVAEVLARATTGKEAR